MKARRLMLAATAGLATLSLGLTACSNTSPGSTSSSTGSTSSTSAASTSTTAKTYTIGVAVIVSHPSLQAVQDGFEAVLKEQNVKYTLIPQNAQGDQANAATIASSFAANKNIDLMLAISTPIALALASAEKTRPIIFSAVTDPVGAGLCPSWQQAGPNITGTSDLNPAGKPIGMVKEAIPGAKTIGILYSSSEPNSLTQVKSLEEEATALGGVTLKEQAITSASEISTGLQALAGVDAILIPTDNTVVAAIATVIAFGQEHKIPVFSSDTSPVNQGTVAARGVSYNALGRRAGEMAVSILRDGKPVSSIPPEAPSDTQLVVNPDAAKTFGLTLPDAFLKGATIVTTQQ
ncbi:MAG: ABC transporter substrate-binding protein [Actinomycetia bacterium]|nr:ABC transporter substrate-binding protein [Actinomycetes bacterium]